VGTERSLDRGTPSGRSHLSYFKRKLKSELLYAHLAPLIALPKFKPRRPGAKAGLIYEAKVLAALRAKPGFIAHLPFCFNEGEGKKYAIPDGLLFSRDFSEVCVVEIKIRHTADAYHQLNDFYIPIVHRAFGGALRVFGLEICKNYDPLIRLPRPPSHVICTDEAFTIRDGFHPILLWSRFDGRVA
jgi:hypothetical protein